MRTERFYIFIIIFILIFANGCQNSNSELHSRSPLKTPSDKMIVSKIIDGDTYKVLMKGDEYKVRLIGIDTPESSHNSKTIRDSRRTGRDIESIIGMGNTATEFVLKYLKEGDSIKLEYDVQHYDKYNRILAYVYLMDGRMLNEILLREGYAQIMTIPPNVRYQELFLKAQREARENQRGLWKMFN